MLYLLITALVTLLLSLLLFAIGIWRVKARWGMDGINWVLSLLYIAYILLVIGLVAVGIQMGKNKMIKGLTDAKNMVKNTMNPVNPKANKAVEMTNLVKTVSKGG